MYTTTNTKIIKYSIDNFYFLLSKLYKFHALHIRDLWHGTHGTTHNQNIYLQSIQIGPWMLYGGGGQNVHRKGAKAIQEGENRCTLYIVMGGGP